MKVLNVGGCNKRIPIPQHYAGWDHLMLDIEPHPDVDVVCDSRTMTTNMDDQAGSFDAVYCSHNLEHYFRHDLPKVLAGFKMIITDEGFVEIRVPNMKSLFRKLAAEDMDIEDTMYVSDAGPIKAVDMIYGMGAFIESSGNDFMCHKTGFTPKSLGAILLSNGFPHVFIGDGEFDIIAYAFKNKPSADQMAALNLKYPEGATS